MPIGIFISVLLPGLLLSGRYRRKESPAIGANIDTPINARVARNTLEPVAPLVLRIVNATRGALVIGTVKSRRRATPASSYENRGIVFAGRGFAEAQLANWRLVEDFLKGPPSVARMAER